MPFSPRLTRGQDNAVHPSFTLRTGQSRLPLVYSEDRQMPFDSSLLTGKLRLNAYYRKINYSVPLRSNVSLHREFGSNLAEVNAKRNAAKKRTY